MKKTEKSRRQHFKEGAIVKIELSGNRLAFGRLLPGIASKMYVYDLFALAEDIPALNEIVNKPVLFCCGLYRSIITKGIYEIIGQINFTEDEVNRIPPFFKQDLVNINDCLIYWNDGRERKATPQECVGLERSSVWDEKSIVERIEDHYAGKRNFHVEHQKVILSKEDPRYMPPPQALRWDFEKRVFYRTDK